MPLSLWRRHRAASADRRASSLEERERWESLKRDRELAIERMAYIETQTEVLARIVARGAVKESK